MGQLKAACHSDRQPSAGRPQRAGHLRPLRGGERLLLLPLLLRLRLLVPLLELLPLPLELLLLLRLLLLRLLLRLLPRPERGGGELARLPAPCSRDRGQIDEPGHV